LGTHLVDLERSPRLSLQRHRLELLNGPDAGKSWDLPDGEVRVGKTAENDVAIPDATVSRHHFSLTRDRQGILLRDLGSTNGTFLDGARVLEAYVHPGMEIRVGEVLLCLRPVEEEVSITPSSSATYGPLVGESPAMRRIFALLERVAPSDATVLILGETGAGKGAAARAIHGASPRADQPLVTIDCGAISRSLIESELFGHEKGAFTGATTRRRGALEMAHGGTLFIDELDDLPRDLQPKLLRALDEGRICRVGSARPVELDLRVLAATKKDLRREVAEGRFREDLYYRLSVVTVPLPPLRDRLEDVPVLAARFLEGEQRRWDDLPRSLRRRLMSHHYPGNVRELRNLLERSIFLDGPEMLDLERLHPGGGAMGNEIRLAASSVEPFKEAKEGLVARFEREYLERLLERTGGNIAAAAREASIDRKHLYTLLKKYGLHDVD